MSLPLFLRQPFWNCPSGRIASLVLTVQGIEALNGRSATTWDGIRRGLCRFWAYASMTIVTWAAVLGAIMVAMIPFLIVTIALLGLLDGPLSGAMDWIPSPQGFGISPLAEWMGFTICVIVPLFILFTAPAYYLGARWYVACPALIVEGTGPIESLRRSWHLGVGNVKRIVGYVLLLNLLMTVLPLVFEMALVWIFDITVPTGAPGLLLRLPAAFSSLFLIVSRPFGVSAAVLLYFELRIRKESYDLELRVAELEEQVSRPAGQDAP